MTGSDENPLDIQAWLREKCRKNVRFFDYIRECLKDNTKALEAWDDFSKDLRWALWTQKQMLTFLKEERQNSREGFK